MTIAIGRPFQLGRQPWKTFDPFLFCVYHEDRFPKGVASTLGPDPALLRGRELTSDFSYKDGWSMYHGTTVPGFPAHPHFGFETVTAAMKGLVDHFDSLGATGRYGHGDVQWMTAGNGVQHSEMLPLVNDKEANPLELFQLWLNLPAAKKTADPYFEMMWAPEVPKIHSGDAEITVMAGPLASATPKRPPPDSWAAVPDNEVAIWVLKIKKGGSVTLPAARFGSEINRAVYFFKGGASALSVRAKSSDAAAGAASLAVSTGLQVDASAEIILSAANDGDAEVLLLQGRPINEKVVQRGPFVVNSAEQLNQVFQRFHQTEFGGWPWPSTDHHHPKEQTRFAKRPGATENEYPPEQEK
jgi:redox-sensitive bicupin YhaK (pirin superfamily)